MSKENIDFPNGWISKSGAVIKTFETSGAVTVADFGFLWAAMFPYHHQMKEKAFFGLVISSTE